ncbi:hypothetical protein QE664_24530, partial [Escherichia coli]|nr:hypothetical protein [Escherichia coli]
SSTSKYWQPELEASSRALMKRLQQLLKSRNVLFIANISGKRKLTAVCSHQTRIGNLDAHLI